MRYKRLVLYTKKDCQGSDKMKLIIKFMGMCIDASKRFDNKEYITLDSYIYQK